MPQGTEKDYRNDIGTVTRGNMQSALEHNVEYAKTLLLLFIHNARGSLDNLIGQNVITWECINGW